MNLFDCNKTIIHLRILSILIILLLSCASQQSSVLKLPKPTGSFGVGSIRYYFVDSTRLETFTPDTEDYREVAIRIWYPANKSSCIVPISYIEYAEERKLALPEKSPLPASFFDKVSEVKSNSYQDAQIADQKLKYPILIFSHGYGAGMNQSTVLMEELASHGYILISVGHAFETNHFIKTDGSVKVFNPQNKELLLRGYERQEAMPFQEKINQTNDNRELETLIRKIMDKRPKIMESLRIWIEDISFVIDKLEKMNDEPGFFHGRLDLERIGVLGHSFGGVAAGQACLFDKRCKAGVNLDGLQLGDMLDRNLTLPFKFMHHDNVGALNKKPNKIFFERSESTAYMIIIKGTRHLNFSDFSLPGYAALLGLPEGSLGEIDGLRCLKIQNDYIRAFFDKHLEGIEAEILVNVSIGYPEVDIMLNPK
jgi:predicted dienelactone hydrolase